MMINKEILFDLTTSRYDLISTINLESKLTAKISERVLKYVEIVQSRN